MVESLFPQCQFFAQVEEIDEAKVKKWSMDFSQVSLVVLGAGPPCQGVSKLNADCKGALKDHRIRDLVRSIFHALRSEH